MRVWIAGLTAMPVAVGLCSMPSKSIAEQAHVHGHSTINIAAETHEGDMHVVAEVTVPGADLVGFEYQPRTAEDKAALEAALATLGQADNVLMWPEAAECRIVASTIVGDAEHDEHDHDEHDHDDHTEEEAEHDEHERAEHDDGEVHAEHVVMHEFECAAPDKIDHMVVKLNESFPSIEEVEINIVTDLGQAALGADRQGQTVELNSLFD